MKFSKHLIDPVCLQSPPPHSQALREINAFSQYSHIHFFIYHSFFPANPLLCSLFFRVDPDKGHLWFSKFPKPLGCSPLHLQFPSYLKYLQHLSLGTRTFILETISSIGHCGTSVSSSLTILLSPFAISDMLECLNSLPLVCF